MLLCFDLGNVHCSNLLSVLEADVIIFASTTDSELRRGQCRPEASTEVEIAARLRRSCCSNKYNAQRPDVWFVV